MARWPIRIPTPGAGERLGRVCADGSLVLCSPLTPTLNTLVRMHWSARRRWRESAYLILLAQYRHCAVNWRAERVQLTVSRCSMATVAADHDNVVGGLKDVIDCLVDHPTRPCLRLFPDDDPQHLEYGLVEDKPRGHWGAGPGTWLCLKPVEGDRICHPHGGGWR